MTTTTLSPSPPMAITGAAIAQLLIMYGPTAIQLIQNLIQNWTNPMTTDQVNAALSLASNPYQHYIDWGKQQTGQA